MLLQLRFAGKDVSPERIRSVELGRVISAWEDAVARTVVDEHPELNKNDIVVSLVQVQDGSLELAFQAPLGDVVMSSALKVIESVGGELWGRLPSGALDSLREIQRFVRLHKCVAELQAEYAGRVIRAKLTDNTVIPGSALLYGQTELIGEVKRVGGIKPKVEFKTIQGETLFCDTTEEIAKALGHHLYEQVKVEGKATWDYDAENVEEFEIIRFVERVELDPQAGFRELRQSIGIYFSDIEDVDAWVYEQRHD